MALITDPIVLIILGSFSTGLRPAKGAQLPVALLASCFTYTNCDPIKGKCGGLVYVETP